MSILTGMARKLIDAGHLEEAKVMDALQKANSEDTPLIHYLVAHNFIQSEIVAQVASKEYGIPYFDCENYDEEFLPNSGLKPDLIEKMRVVPIFKRGNELFVAIADPSDLHTMDDVKFQTSMQPNPVIVEDEKLTDLIRKAMSSSEMESLGDLSDEDLSSLDIATGDNIDLDESNAADDTPIVKFINKTLLDAINSNVSDIHFEPYEKYYRIRYRQDGILQEAAKPPKGLSQRFSARIKVMSNLDISERRVPQDGRFKMKIGKHRGIDFRVSTCPTLFGEKIVMRILDPTATKLGIDSLGFENFQKQAFETNIHKPQGMVLVTGPTGSGKTITLYTALSILNKIERNISTAEDPVEINLGGINQVNVNPKAGLTFASALRSFLRQDPDVVMVGEIRDLETAEIAIKASQTGHMVLSTLHTNSAADTLTRLINMGIPSYNLATSVSLVVAQRLARRLCKECKTEADIPVEAKLKMGFKPEEVDELKIFHANGCKMCKNGYKGRIGIYEVMPVSKAIGEIIMRGGNALDIEKQAQAEGVWNLREAGLNKIRQGLTSFEEVERVTKE